MDAALHILCIAGYIFGYLAHRWIHFWISCALCGRDFWTVPYVVSYSIVRLPGVCGNRSRLDASQHVSSLQQKRSEKPGSIYYFYMNYFGLDAGEDMHSKAVKM